jgi:hypothetical protein
LSRIRAIETAFAALVRNDADALVVGADPFFFPHRGHARLGRE